MATQVLLTTTGTLGTVPIADLNGIEYTHPTVDANLLLNFTYLDISSSVSLAAAITAGYITLRDENLVNIPDTGVPLISASIPQGPLITPGTNTKFTYNKYGIITAATAATTADINDSTNRRYVTDAQLTVIGNTSGTNSGDQTITLTGPVTGSGTGSFATTITAGAVTLSKMADVATATVFYRKTAGTGAPEVQTLATLKTDLGLTGTNTGDVPILVQDEGSPLTTNAKKFNFVGGIITATVPVADEVLVTLPSYGTGAGTVCQGNDSRLSDDRTASGLRTATGIVAIAAAAAPIAGDLLVATSPTLAEWQAPGAFPGSVKQTDFIQVETDQSTASLSFVDLLSLTLTGVGANNRVAIFATACGSINGTGKLANYRLLVDGVSSGGATIELKTSGISGSVAITVRTAPLTAGSHTFKLQWSTSSNTLSIRPVTAVDQEHAGLLLQEISL